jgi:hypothetical protein
LRRESQLLREHYERWMREDGLTDLVNPWGFWHNPPKLRFRRGFIDRTWFASPEEFRNKAPEVFARAPVTGASLHAATPSRRKRSSGSRTPTSPSSSARPACPCR